LYWSTHVCTPYLDCPDARWFDAGLPVVGYFHDREPALLGVQWVAECLDRWSSAGARRWIGFGELAAALCRTLYVTHAGGAARLQVCEDNAPDLPRALPVRVYTPQVDSEVEPLDLKFCREVPIHRIGPTSGEAVLAVPGRSYRHQKKKP